MTAIEEYDSTPEAIGFDSLGNAMLLEKGQDSRGTHVYQSMMQKWKAFFKGSTDLETPPEHVAKTVRGPFVSSESFVC